jgi:hypothetical protein
MGESRKGLAGYILGVTTLAWVGVVSLSAGGVAAGEPSTPGSPSALTAARWSALPPGPLASRYNQVSLWTGTDFLIWGGVSDPTQATCPCPQHALNDGAIFNPQSKRWATMAKSPLAARVSASAVWTGRLALIWGGQTEGTNGTFELLNSGASFDPSTNRWARLPASPLSPRESVAVFWTGKVAIFIGGEGEGKPIETIQSVTDVATYNPSTHRWNSLPSIPTEGLGTPTYIAATWTGTALLAFSTFETPGATAANASFTTFHQTAQEWVPGHATWHRLPSPPLTASIYSATAFPIDHRVVFLSGNTGNAFQFTRPADIFNLTTGRWSKSPTNPVFVDPMPATSTGSAIVVIATGGSSGPGVSLSAGDTVALDPVTDKVTRLASAPMGRGTGELSIAWTGKSVLLWGVGDSGRPVTFELLEK